MEVDDRHVTQSARRTHPDEVCSRASTPREHRPAVRQKAMAKCLQIVDDVSRQRCWPGNEGNTIHAKAGSAPGALRSLRELENTKARATRRRCLCGEGLAPTQRESSSHIHSPHFPRRSGHPGATHERHFRSSCRPVSFQCKSAEVPAVAGLTPGEMPTCRA
jgi:hypothetical protein